MMLRRLWTSSGTILDAPNDPGGFVLPQDRCLRVRRIPLGAEALGEILDEMSLVPVGLDADLGRCLLSSGSKETTCFNAGNKRGL